jgi:hypothetical protein
MKLFPLLIFISLLFPWKYVVFTSLNSIFFLNSFKVYDIIVNENIYLVLFINFRGDNNGY